MNPTADPSTRTPDATAAPSSPAGRAAPAHIALLGYGGLLPFVGLAALSGLNPVHAPAWSTALRGYGAVILSFVGALHWGVAMSAATLAPAQRRRAFIWSVVPALLAWPATVLGPVGSTGLLITGFALNLAEDHRLAGPARLPAWYLPLRWRLSVVACLCLLMNALLTAGWV